jgi:predicted nucleotidyltransferase
MTTQELQKVDLHYLRQLLASHPSIDSAALYGSVARGDVESHSDIDVLLICRASRKLPVFHEIRKVLENSFDRLSLTIYSESELNFLDSARSLFLLHLSREAVLLFDKNCFLGNMLSNFRPKQSYRSDFDKCLKLIDPLRTAVEGAPNQLHRLSYIYSLFRVFGVYLLAEMGIYEFSKARMVRLLADNFPDQRGSVERLSTLRLLNSNFFTGGSSALTSSEGRDSLQAKTHALASLVQVQIDVKLASYGDAIEEFEIAVGDRKRALDYRLRMWFLLLVYDGLNLYCSRHGRGLLTSFSECALSELIERDTPEAISHAISEAKDYLYRYPLKYFLSDESKISAQGSRTILRGIRDELAIS